MSSQRTHLISITLTPTSADLVEAKRSGQAVQILRRSTLVFAQDAGLDQPAALGAALAEHLKANSYATRHAVIGLCPRWVLARHKHVPPADRDSMRGIVNLQIEREFAASASDMTFDYVLGQGSTQVPLLLAGVRTSVLRQAQQAAQAAGLKIEAITPTSLAGAHGRAGTVVLIEQGVAGVMRVQDGMVVGLVSCQADADNLHDSAARSRLLTDIARSTLQLPSDDSGAGLTLILPASVTQPEAKLLTDEAGERFGNVTLHQADATELLASYATAQDTMLIDFTSSRLAAPKRRQIPPTMKWSIRAAVLALLIGGTIGYLWFDATSRRDALQGEYDAIKDRAAELQAVRADIRLAAAWYDKRPPALDCLLELTRTFPTQGQIRVETLTMNRDMTGQIDCSAEDRETMDDYFIQMQRSSALLAVNRGSVRPAGGRNTWIDFPIAFRFDPTSAGGAQ